MSRRARSRFAASLGAALLGALVFAAPASAAPEPADVIEITLDDATPHAFDPESELTLTGTLINRSDEPLESVTLWWRMQTAVLTPEMYDAWFAYKESYDPLTFARHDLPEQIAPGEAVEYRMLIPPESSPFDAASPPGARGMEIVVTAKGAEGNSFRNTVRSSIVWFGDDEQPVPVTVAVPLAPLAEEWSAAYDERVPVGPVAFDRLSGLIDAFDEVPVTWGVDAALFDPVPIGGVERLFGDTPDDFEDDDPFDWATPAEIGQLSNAIREHLADGEKIISLGWATPDYSSFARSGTDGAELAAANTRYSDDVLRRAGMTASEAVRWSFGALSPSVHSAAVPGVATVLTPPIAGGAYHPGQGKDPALYSPSTEFVDLLTAKLSPAELAAKSLILSQTSRAHVVTLPADLTLETATQIAANLRTMSGFSWIEFAPLEHTIASLSAADEEVASNPAPTPKPSAQVVAAARFLRSADALAPITPDPAKFEALAYSTIFAPLPELHELAGAALGDSPLRIQKPSTVNLISQGGTLPIGIENASRMLLAPTVVLDPADARLLANEPVRGNLGPQQSTTVHLPITAVANGNVEATIHVLGPAGEELAEPKTFTVRVRADWETTGTAIIAGLVAVGFVFGLIRNIRKASAQGPRE